MGQQLMAIEMPVVFDSFGSADLSIGQAPDNKFHVEEK
jgi:hypothetical protein